MARKKPTAPAPLETTIQDLTDKLTKALEQNAALLEMVNTQSAAKTALQSRLANMNSHHQNAFSELMVGIRNVSDNTIGIPGAFGNADVQLHADFGDGNPGCATMVSYAWYRELLKTKHFRNGQIIRDDSVLGTGFSQAPEDRPEDLPPEAAANVVLDPRKWIDSRDEGQIRAGIDAMTSEESLQRLRRAVDDQLRALEATRPRSTKAEQVAAAKWALSMLPGKYRLVDEVITMRLERPDDEADYDRPILIK